MHALGNRVYFIHCTYSSYFFFLLQEIVFFSDVLGIFFRQVYCSLRFSLISQYPFLLHVHPIIFFSVSLLSNWLDFTSFSDFLASYSICFCFVNYLLRTFIPLASFIYLVQMLPPLFLVRMSLFGRLLPYIFFIFFPFSCICYSRKDHSISQPLLVAFRAWVLISYTRYSELVMFTHKQFPQLILPSCHQFSIFSIYEQVGCLQT